MIAVNKLEVKQVVKAVCRLQREMIMPVPATAIQPESQSIVLRRVPGEFETIVGFGIVDGCPAFANEGRKNLFAIAICPARVQGVEPLRAVQQCSRRGRQVKLIASLQP